MNPVCEGIMWACIAQITSARNGVQAASGHKRSTLAHLEVEHSQSRLLLRAINLVLLTDTHLQHEGAWAGANRKGWDRHRGAEMGKMDT